MRPLSLLIASLLTTLVMLSGCREEKKTPPAAPRKVSYLLVGESDFGRSRRISGAVEAGDRTDLSFQINGRIANVGVSTGDNVTQGQMLATLERDDFELALKSANSRVASTQATLDEMTEMLRRQRALFARGHVSQAAVDTARSRFEAARSNHAVSTAERDLALLNLDRTVLSAPFDGQIAERIAEPFMEISSRQTLFRIQQPSTLSVRVLVPENMVRQIALDDVVEITFPSLPNAVIPGFISQIGALASQGNAFSVKVDLKDNGYDIRAGMTAQVMFHLKQGKAASKSAFLIPLSALDLRQGAGQGASLHLNALGERQAFVLVINPATMTLESRAVTVNDIQNNHVRITQGLKAGERIVIAGVAFLQPGEKVSLWQPTVAPAEVTAP
ncbi:MAG: efflux RND transporter periplasmic adaptor subunit [Alphaproteobacteria bacterium]